MNNDTIYLPEEERGKRFIVVKFARNSPHYDKDSELPYITTAVNPDQVEYSLPIGLTLNDIVGIQFNDVEAWVEKVSVNCECV